MTEIGLGFGSNIGDKAAHIFQAVRYLLAGGVIRNFRLSSLYRTAPWGNVDQDWFVNACGIGETELSPTELLAFVQSIEQRMGRQRIVHWGPRNIDIDVLFYGEEKLDLPDLTIPHVQVLNRAFVLLPLLELKPDLMLGGVLAREALARLDASDMVRMEA